MKAFVIDTNVPIVADDTDEAVSAGCIRACHEALTTAINSVVCLDDGQRILAEYIRQVGLIGRPGIGRQFVKWIHERQAMPEHCERVAIRPSNEPHEAENYEEFPDDAELRDFDPSDRKFVAVALASQFRPPVVNATDSDWWNDRKVLERNGVVIEFLCPDAFFSHVNAPFCNRRLRVARPKAVAVGLSRRVAHRAGTKRTEVTTTKTNSCRHGQKQS